MTIEERRIAAYRQARVFEPSMDGYAGAMAVYHAAFPDGDGFSDVEALHVANLNHQVAGAAGPPSDRIYVSHRISTNTFHLWRDVENGTIVELTAEQAKRVVLDLLEFLPHTILPTESAGAAGTDVKKDGK